MRAIRSPLPGADTLRQSFSRQKQLLLWCLCSTFLFGLLAHAYGFFHCSLSHDYLNAFLATARENAWKIRLGRFFVPLYRSVFRNAAGLPWLIGILGLFWTSLSAFLVCRLFRVESRPLIILICGMMATNITYIAQIATYLYEFDCNALALLFSVLAVYLWDSTLLPADAEGHRFSSGRGLLAALCILVSLGLYQAYFDVAVTLIIALCLRDLLEKASAAAVLRRGLWGVAVLLLGGVFYLAVGKLIYACTGLSAQSRTDLFATGGQNIFLLYLGLVKSGLYFWFMTTAHSAYNIASLPVCVFGLTGLLLCITAMHFYREKYGFSRFFLALLLLIAMPFGMICVYFGARGCNVHDLMVYAVWFLYIFLLLLSFRLYRLRPGLLTKLTRAAALILVSCLLWQNVVLANTAYSKKELESTAALSTMTRVVSDLEHQPDYVYGETPVAFFGIFDGSGYLFEDTAVRRIEGLSCDTPLWDDGVSDYYSTYKAYFNFVLQYKINLCDEELRQKLAEDPRVTQMPTYPSQGYIQNIDGVLVVRFPN